MKTKLLFALFAGILMLTNSCIQAQTKSALPGKSDEEQVKSMLKDFYTGYISTIAAGADDYGAKLEALTKKYCTTKLTKKIEKDQADGMDYDPYIKAQDADSAWLKTLSIQKDAQKPNGYTASYMDNSSHKKITISLLVIKQGENFKIDSVH